MGAALLAFGAVGSYRLLQCKQCMIMHSNTAIAIDYRTRLAKQNPNHPLVQHHYKLLQQQQQQHGTQHYGFISNDTATLNGE